ncbi:MAG: DNA primase, partial [Steroidobacteraceae bacterium]|nr:DNA primase [Steroidobacteraceae bacterium]
MRRRGTRWLGLCPFHQEKTPSFFVHPELKFYHCFGCGAHGDCIDYVQSKRQLSFVDAVRFLADRANISLPDRNDPNERRKRAVLAALAAADACFRDALEGPDGVAARDFLARRGIDDAVRERFGLGWVEGDARTLDRLDSIAPAAVLREAGLAGTNSAGAWRSFFRRRVTIPIRDRLGRVLGFGARAIDQRPAKFVNSPESVVFSKGRHLYGLDLASRLAARSGYLVLVEGYFDVIALLCREIPAVAVLGTACSAEQMTNAWRIAPRLVLAFDGDQPGRDATARAIDAALPLLGAANSLSIARMPDGMDPDALARARPLEEVRRLFERAEPLEDALWERIRGTRDVSAAAEHAALRRDLRDTVQRVRDRDVRAALAEALWSRLRTATRPSQPWRADLPTWLQHAVLLRECELLASVIHAAPEDRAVLADLLERAEFEHPAAEHARH